MNAYDERDHAEEAANGQLVLEERTVDTGDHLANGAVVLLARPSTRHQGATVFLALWRDEFVTWIGRADGTDTTWGHYFRRDDLARAADDYAAR